MARAGRDPQLRGDRPAGGAVRRRWASATCASPAASRSSGATSRRWPACWPTIDGRAATCRVTTNGFLLGRDAERLVRAGINRFNVSVDSLQRDRFYEMTRRDALDQVLHGLETLAAFPEAHPIKVNAVAIRGFTEEEVVPFAAAGARDPVRGPLHRVHAAGRRPRLDARAGPHRRGDPRGDRGRLPAGGRAARAQRHRARLSLRRRQRPDRLHQPGLRAVLRRLQPGPPHRRRPSAHLPVLAQRDRSARAAARRRRRRTSSRRSSAPPSGARSSSTTSARRASSSPRAACPPSAADTPRRGRRTPAPWRGRR